MIMLLIFHCKPRPLLHTTNHITIKPHPLLHATNHMLLSHIPLHISLLKMPFNTNESLVISYIVTVNLRQIKWSFWLQPLARYRGCPKVPAVKVTVTCWCNVCIHCVITAAALITAASTMTAVSAVTVLQCIHLTTINDDGSTVYSLDNNQQCH